MCMSRNFKKTKQNKIKKKGEEAFGHKREKEKKRRKILGAWSLIQKFGSS